MSHSITRVCERDTCDSAVSSYFQTNSRLHSHRPSVELDPLHTFSLRVAVKKEERLGLLWALKWSLRNQTSRTQDQHLFKHKSWETPQTRAEALKSAARPHFTDLKRPGDESTAHSSFCSLPTRLNMSFLKRLVICQQTTLTSNSSALLKRWGRRMTFIHICPNSAPPSRDATLMKSRFSSWNVPVSHSSCNRPHMRVCSLSRPNASASNAWNERVKTLFLWRPWRESFPAERWGCLCSSGFYRVTELPLERIRRVTWIINEEPLTSNAGNERPQWDWETLERRTRVPVRVSGSRSPRDASDGASICSKCLTHVSICLSLASLHSLHCH